MSRLLERPSIPWLLRAVLLIVATAAYWPSFRGAFVFDDFGHIVYNWRLQSFSTFRPELAWNTRPTVYLTLWLNYQIGDLNVLGHHLGPLNVLGYHLLNFAVHCVAGLTLFSLVRGTLRLPPMDKRWGRWADPIAFVAALLWLVHPLQTQAVTYIIQRCESMMGMFYLLALYGLLRASQSARPWIWYITAVAAVWLGMGCKEVMATAPLVILLYDRIYLSSSWAMVFRRRWAFYLAMTPAVAWLVVVVLRNAAVATAGFGSNVGIFLVVLGAILHGNAVLIWLGILLFSSVVVFQIVNLPVEFNASSRAKQQLVTLGIIDQEQLYYVGKMLNAAALTYVAATLQAVMILLYLITRFGGRRN